VRDIASVLQVGERINVRCLGRDVRGMLRLSHKATIAKTEGQRGAGPMIDEATHGPR